ncbi:MAG: hypothetical protein QM831_43025 [Kofleriaceae bacterium]
MRSRHILLCCALAGTAHADSAKQLESTYRAKLTADDRAIVDHAIRDAGDAGDAKTSAAALANRAIVLAGQGAQPAVFITLAAHAVQLAPTSALAWNDLGALVRQVDPKASIAPLQRAVELQPDSAIALVNLGSSQAETGDKRGVETLRKAVKLAPKLGIAHEALGAVLMANGDHQGAATEAQAALDAGDANSGVSALVNAIEKAGDTVDPAQIPGEPAITLIGPDGSSITVASTQHPNAAAMGALTLPPAWTWGNPVDMTNDPTPWGAIVAKALKEGIGGALQFARNYGGAAMHAGADQTRDKINARLTHYKVTTAQVQKFNDMFGYTTPPSSPFSSHERIKFETITAAFTHRAKERTGKLNDAVRTAGKQWKTDFKDEMDLYLSIIKAAQTGSDQAVCNAEKALYDRHRADTRRYFATVQPAFSEWNSLRDEIHDYWRDTTPVIDRIEDTPTFNYAIELRRTATQGFIAAIGISRGTMTLGTYDDGKPFRCDIHSPQQPHQAQHSDDDADTSGVENLPDQKKESCPAFFSQPKTVKIAMIEIKVDCEGGEVSFADGIAVGVKVKFATRETEVFVGAGAELHINEIADLSAKIGATFSFEDGKLTDWGGKASVGVAYSAGPVEGQVEVSATLSAATPARLAMETATGVKLFQPAEKD